MKSWTSNSREQLERIRMELRGQLVLLNFCGFFQAYPAVPPSGLAPHASSVAWLFLYPLSLFLPQSLCWLPFLDSALKCRGSPNLYLQLLLMLCYLCAGAVFFALEAPTVFPNIGWTPVPGSPIDASNPTPPKFSMSSSPQLKCLPSQTPIDKHYYLFIVYETGNVFTAFASHLQSTPRSC